MVSAPREFLGATASDCTGGLEGNALETKSVKDKDQEHKERHGEDEWGEVERRDEAYRHITCTCACPIFPVARVPHPSCI